MTKTTVTLVPSSGHGGIVPADLIEKAREYAQAAKSPGTLRTYAASWKLFTRWCCHFSQG